jgi:hypothetical protein
MTEVAYTPRRRLEILLRRVAFRAFWLAYRTAGRLGQRPPPGAEPRIGVLLPEDAGPTDLGDVCNRLAWYLGGGRAGEGGPEIELVVPPQLQEVFPEAPPEQEDYLSGLPGSGRIQRGAFDPGHYDRLLLWRTRDVLAPRLLRAIARVRTIDPWFYSGVEYAALRETMALSVDKAGEAGLLERSRENFQSLLGRWAGAPAVYVLGTGPSVEEMAGIETGGAPVIVCNSLVRDTELLDRLRPAAVCFTDEVFHFGPSRYAAAFRRDLLQTVERYDCFAITRPDGAALLLRHHPGLAGRLIALPAGAPAWTIPSEKAFGVRATGNILTFYMLPLAAALAGRIRIGGSDGRQPGETYFWRHGGSVQYEGLMETAFRTHPSFFRDRVYSDYYRRHVRLLTDQIAWLERRGRRIESITRTHIPVLQRRAATP